MRVRRLTVNDLIPSVDRGWSDECQPPAAISPATHRTPAAAPASCGPRGSFGAAHLRLDQVGDARCATVPLCHKPRAGADVLAASEDKQGASNRAAGGSSHSRHRRLRVWPSLRHALVVPAPMPDRLMLVAWYTPVTHAPDMFQAARYQVQVASARYAPDMSASVASAVN